MAWAPVVIALAGTAVSTYAAIRQGEQAQAADKYNAQVAANDAAQVNAQAQLQAQQDQRQATLDEGTIAANLGAAGSAGGGSGADVSMDVQNQHNLQTNTDLYLGKIAANKYVSNQQVSQYQASNAMPNAILSAGGALLQGGANSYKAYSQLNTSSSNSMGDQTPQVEF